MYLALAPVVFVVVLAAKGVFARGVPAGIGIIVAIAVAAVLGSVTFARNRVYQSEIALWQDTFGVTLAPSQVRGDPERYLFGTPDGSGGVTTLQGDYAMEVRVAVADPTDSVAEVGTVVGGNVYGLLGTDTGGRDLAEGLLFRLPIALGRLEVKDGRVRARLIEIRRAR